MKPSDPRTDAIEPSTEPATIESVVRSLRRLLEGDQDEQRETFEYLKSALASNRDFVGAEDIVPECWRERRQARRTIGNNQITSPNLRVPVDYQLG